MANKEKDWKEEYEDIKNELLMDKVSNAINEDPRNWRKNMEDIGFTWIDDSQEEKEEEKNAIPKNVNQEYLIGYFEEQIAFNDKLIEVFINEVESENPNYPLFRKYFKAGNTGLLHILISGLSSFPTNQVLLSGLSYFHGNRNVLTHIISAYTAAFNKEDSAEIFKELCIDFINDTNSDGYDALATLKSMFQNNSKKLQIIEEINQIAHDHDEVIKF